ncbi:hypothetical protein RFI_25571 [Reticulomyxa filosa]|uniref:Uncharacterized protein n=1 Tax=Reticulomyxa filosa TaxID=46433 RepID=X6MDS4_RETFI|nr:hypothetical protein RFI_25571 [Reticulomyxa filosa]|eukprot:ETO11806.1 hypothetical protein RFI_25571 [Reticulomyxa filosa]
MVDGIVIHCDRRCLAVVPVVCAQHLYELQSVQFFEMRVDDYVGKDVSSVLTNGLNNNNNNNNAKLIHFFQHLMSVWKTENKEQQFVTMCKKPKDERTFQDNSNFTFEIPVYQWCAIDGASPYYTPLDVLYRLNGIQLYLFLISSNKDLANDIQSLPIVLTGPSAVLFKEYVSTFLSFNVPLNAKEFDDNSTTTPPLVSIYWQYVFDDPQAYHQKFVDPMLARAKQHGRDKEQIIEKIGVDKYWETKKRKPIPNRDYYVSDPTVDDYHVTEIHSPSIPKNQSSLLVGSMKFAQSVKAVKMFFKDKYGNSPLTVLKAIDESLR